MRIVICIFCLHIGCALSGQGFEAAIEIGLNAAQIDGDQYAGYNKLGIHSGLSIAYPIQDTWKIGSGLFYDHLGSQKDLELGNSNPEEQQKIQLSYIHIPLKLIYSPISDKEWIDRLDLVFGIKNGFLLNSKIQDREDDVLLNFFNKWNLAGLFGINYHFGNQTFVSVQLDESMNYLFNNNKEPSINANSLRNRWLTFSISKVL